MILIDEVMISDEVVESMFMCNLNACKGACCWEGDFGAPLSESEIEHIGTHLEKIKVFMDDAGKEAIETQGYFSYFKEENDHGTTLLENGRCAYLNVGESGIGWCSIEKAYKEGTIPFNKPISCHLYPIRVTEEKEADFIALNYDRWDICSAACSLGKSQQMPLYKFAKEALIRRFGEDFFEQLDHTAEYLKSERKDPL